MQQNKQAGKKLYQQKIGGMQTSMGGGKNKPKFQGIGAQANQELLQGYL